MNFDMTPEPTAGPPAIQAPPAGGQHETARVRFPVVPRHNPDTSYGRYFIRLKRWLRSHPKTGLWRHLGWWWLHNIIVHPLIGFLPLGPFFALHDWTSKKLSQQ